MVKKFLEENKNDRLILVVGGGGPARIYQKAFREVTGTAENAGTDAADWIGIMATRLNAQFVKASFGDLCLEPVVTDPTVANEFTGRILVAAGWKPVLCRHCCESFQH
jgi:uridylate kinase